MDKLFHDQHSTRLQVHLTVPVLGAATGTVRYTWDILIPGTYEAANPGFSNMPCKIRE